MGKSSAQSKVYSKQSIKPANEYCTCKLVFVSQKFRTMTLW